MKSLLPALLILVPFGSQADDAPAPLQLTLAYAGSDQYVFEKNSHDYAGLLAAIRAEYGTQHITSISVDMGDDTNLADRLKVCRLKLDTGAQVMLHFTSDGQQTDIYCA